MTTNQELLIVVNKIKDFLTAFAGKRLYLLQWFMKGSYYPRIEK